MLTAIIIIFVLGYLAIALEHQLHINKAASALMIGMVCWTLYALDVQQLLPAANVPEWFVTEALHEEVPSDEMQRHFMVDHQLLHVTAEIAQILFFLMGAMTIVELVDAHEGFALITARVQAKNYTTLVWVLGWMTFFLSSVLDNLTTTIVMISLLRKLVPDRDKRLMFAGLVVIAANAGGAWTVIGDVTTTMLWIKKKIGTVEVMWALFLPSVACLLVPQFVLARTMRGEIPRQEKVDGSKMDSAIRPWHQWLFLLAGLAALLSVPVFKANTHLPPFMGMLLGLACLWCLGELVSHTLDEATRSSTGVLAVLKRVDMSGILFFLGILMAVGVLSATGTLPRLATWLDGTIRNNTLVAIIIGLVSAVVDNVPLVAAGIEMYQFKLNDPFWMLLAYCAGTGGSCLIIGSAAGVAAMGLENINFMWYFRRITPWALLGYFSGIAVYWVQSLVF